MSEIIVVNESIITTVLAGQIGPRGDVTPAATAAKLAAQAAQDAAAVSASSALVSEAAANNSADAAAVSAAASSTNLVATNNDVVTTNADRVQTGLDVIATAADRVQTSLDVIATAADRVQTGLDVIATAADRVQTGLDVIATAADRVQTGIDANTATATSIASSNYAASSLLYSQNSASSAEQSANSAVAAQTSATSSASSATEALAYKNDSEASSLASAVSAQTASVHASTTHTDKDTVSALLLSFRKILLGAFASDLEAETFATANGIPITDGIMYENSVIDKFRVYNGISWQDYDSSAQTLQAAAALSAANAAESASTSAEQAGISTIKAEESSAFAVLAANKATIATDKAVIATDKAVVSVEQAVIATSKAELTGEDRLQTGLDRIQTDEDRVQTGLDRIQTGQDREAAAVSASSAAAQVTMATTQADIATTKAGEAADSEAASELAATAALTHTQTAGEHRVAASGFADSANTSANSSSQSSNVSTIKALEASNSASHAQAQALAAAASAATAAAVVTGGTASAVAAPGKIPLSNGAGGFDASWQAAFMAGALQPTNVSPTPDQLYLTETPTVTASVFQGLYGASQSAIQVQVNTTSDFSAPLYNSGDQPASTSFVLPFGLVAANTQYWWRVRYKTVTGAYSEWSVATSFTTKSVFDNDYIYAPTSTPAAFGDPLEGGYYTGMIWNQLVQSSDSKTIATGALVLTVPNMTGTPICYSNQTLEVRSRANPANKMVGVVTGAVGTALTLNITSVGGSGTFSDWSVMAQYRVIVAPKATGEISSRQYKNANTPAPTACQTVAEGYLATAAMVAAGDSSIYPAAWFCKNLNIGGKTDWYLPARDELELCWRNLKPTTADNYAKADRFDSGINYTNLGALDDYDQSHGRNSNSSPAGEPYTPTIPAQGANVLFQTGGAQAFAYGSFYYWSSSECSSTFAWNHGWHSSNTGLQGYNNKAAGSYVRAVRRSII